MAYELPGLMISLPAAGDLSAGQYKFVALNSAGRVAICTGATDIPVGVLQNKPSAIDQAAEIMVIGVTKLAADAVLVPAQQVGPSADGQADARLNGTDTTEYIVGQILVGATTAGGLTSALINCAAPHRGA